MRFLFYLILGVILLTLLRSVIETIGKAFAGGPSEPQHRPVQGAQSLKRDPVCGTFVSEATAIQKTKGGETYYFCSAACRDKF